MRQLIILLSILSVSFVTAQQNPLPRYMTAEEEALMPGYIAEALNRNDSRSSPNLPNNPRAMAEWEELRGIVIAWSNGFAQIQSEIVRHAREEVVVYIVTTNETSVKNRLDIEGVDYSSNVEFIDTDYNSLWIRDYGPNTVYINEVDSMVIVDWIYNRPRFADDQVPQAVGVHLGIHVLETANQPDDLVHTGGNFMSNGNGQGFSSELVLEENGPDNNWGTSNHSEEDVDQIMENYMGINEYVKMVNLPFDLIHHIDMHMKMLDEETIIVGEYPEGIADGPQIEANIQYVLDNYQTTFDREFKIIRIPMPPDANDRYPNQNGDYRTYANAMFVNKTILVPIYEEQYDIPALEVWREAMPGHKVVGIDCNDIIPLSGALHCIIKEIGVTDPMWILHQPIRTAEVGEEEDHKVTATIKHKAEVTEAFLFYSIDDGQTYDSVSMTLDGSNVWSAYLPDESPQDFIYYIRAHSVNNKMIERPQTGSQGGGYRFSTNMSSTQEEVNMANSVGSVFPNPASAITAIPIQLNKSQDIEVTLTKSSGQQVATIFNGTYPTTKTHVFFDASIYANGAYLVHVKTKDEIITRKVIVAN